MSTPSRRLAGLMLLAVLWTGLLAAPAPVQAANAEPLDLEPDLSAKLGREKLKQNQQANAKDRRGGAGKGAGCGQIDIGNSGGNQRGSGAVSGRERTVIVTGPVINATNCR